MLDLETSPIPRRSPEDTPQVLAEETHLAFDGGSLLAVPPGGRDEVCPFYWEAKNSARCTLHTTNRLLGDLYYTASKFDALPEDMAREAHAFGKEPHPLQAEFGNYDLRVLKGALLREGKTGPAGTTFFVANRTGDVESLMTDILDGTAQGVVVRRSYPTRGVTRGTIPTGQWWNLDSVLLPPAKGPSPMFAHKVFPACD